MQGNMRKGDLVQLDEVACRQIGSFAMGEKGVETVAKVMAGDKVEEFVNTGVAMVYKNNIHSDEAKNVLY